MPAKKAAKKAAKEAASEAPAKKAAKKAAKKTAAKSETKPAASPPKDVAKAAYLNYRSRVEQGIYGDQVGDWLAAEKSDDT
jgi:hypothetical protein